MEFGIGFAAGGLLTGLAFSHMTLIHVLLTKMEGAAKRKAESAEQSLTSKL